MSKLSAEGLRDAWAYILTGENVHNSTDLVVPADAVTLIQQHIDALEAENARLRTQVERGDALAVTMDAVNVELDHKDIGVDREVAWVVSMYMQRWTDDLDAYRAAAAARLAEES